MDRHVPRKSQTRRTSKKKNPNNEEVTDELLQALIAASKFFVSVKIIGLSAVEPEASSSSKRLSVGSNEPEWRETIGELEFRLGEKRFSGTQWVERFGSTSLKSTIALSSTSRWTKFQVKCYSNCCSSSTCSVHSGLVFSAVEFFLSCHWQLAPLFSILASCLIMSSLT